jgi:hypothetical protein
MNWKNYFEMLKDWKKLPAYKVEPRIDSLIGYYLPVFLSDFLNVKIIGSIPELPIRLGTVKSSHEGSSYADRSYKVDFLAIGDNGLNYLVEFKTDSKSRRDNQDIYLVESKILGTKNIIDGIIKITKVSNYTEKYNHLKAKLRECGLLNAQDSYTGLNPKFEIVYVQPSNYKKETNVIDFLWIAEWLKEHFKDSEFERELSESLIHWSRD